MSQGKALTKEEINTWKGGISMGYQDYETGKPYRGGDRGYFRRDRYKPTGEYDRFFVTGRNDLSPVFCGKYNPECPCCWLGFGHSEAVHERSEIFKGVN